MKFYVIRYDINGMAEDPENPGHAVGYMDPTVSAPEPLEPVYPTPDEAAKRADELNAASGGEEIEVTLANGKPYKGPRYVYRVAEST